MIEKLKVLKRELDHKKMEIFMAQFIALSLVIALIVGLCTQQWIVKSNRTMGDEAMYSQDFSSSFGVSGNVVNVYGSDDKTKAFVLLKFNDATTMSPDAKDYQMFLTGYNMGKQKRQDLDSVPSGAWYVFGDTGYAGVYLTNAASFHPQIMDLIVRLKAQMLDNVSPSGDDTGDASFNKFNQFRIQFNPGANKTVKLPCLNENKAPSVKDMYLQSVAANQEKLVKEQLEKDESALYTDLTKISKTKDKLIAAGVVYKDDVNTPKNIRGDKVNMDGSGKDAKYTFKPKTVLPGGYDFDWRKGDLAKDKGYFELLPGINEDKIDYDKFFAAKTAERKKALDEANSQSSVASTDTDANAAPDDAANGGTSENGDGQTSTDSTGTTSNSLSDDEKWQVYIDKNKPDAGTQPLANLAPDMVNDDYANTRYKPIVSNIDLLDSACQDYISVKSDYQVTQLGKLLALEASAKSVETSSSVNAGKKVLLIY